MMKRSACFLFAAIALFLFANASSAEEPLKISVQGDVIKPGQWTIDDLKKQFAKDMQTVKFSQGDGAPEQTGTGIPLYTLIQAAALKTAPSIKHHDLSFLAYVEARDSYRAFFSIYELMPESEKVPVWLFWDVNGKPLTGNDAPCRLLVVGDKGQSRSVFGIAVIRLIDGARLASQPPSAQK